MPFACRGSSIHPRQYRHKGIGFCITAEQSANKKLTAEGAEYRRHNEKPVHRKGREGRKGNQNLNHKGTRKETQGHEGKKQRKFFAGKQDFQG
jgi:hypothetical protein